MFKTILRILTLPATSEVYGSSSFVASSSSGFNTPTSTSDPDMDAETQTPFSSTLLTKDVAKKMVRFEDVCDLMELEQRERLLNEFYSNPLQLTGKPLALYLAVAGKVNIGKQVITKLSSKALQKGKELHLVIEKYPTYQLAYKVGLLVGAVPAAAYTITLASSALTAASIGLAVFTTVLITATTVLLVVVIAVATTAATISAAVLSVGIAAEKLKLGGGGGNRLAIVGATTPGGKPLIRSDIQAKAIEKVDTITGKLIAFAHSAADFLINRLT